MGHQCISVRTRGNSNTHANSYARPNANGNSYANPDTNGYADANRNSYAYVYRHCHTHSNANSDALPRRMETWLPLNDFLSRFRRSANRRRLSPHPGQWRVCRSARNERNRRRREAGDVRRGRGAVTLGRGHLLRLR